MIKNIVFDLGGVIIDLDRKTCLDNFDTILGFPHFGEFLNAYAQQGFFAKFEDGALDVAGFRACVREHAKKDEITDVQIDFALCSFLSGIKSEKGKLLLELKHRGYPLYLLSNNNPIAWECSKTLLQQNTGLPVEKLFDHLFLSYEMKLSKPGKAIFEKMLAQLGGRPAETLFIDDAQANIETAREMGFATLLYHPADSLPDKVKEALERYG